ncbi:MAG: LacI family DNA-binding transcriptional regulator [Pseudomonadota bacterium]|nr:LacI family DNA-binding transcriptional regulator [Pseudomonadota bacterium]
MFAASANRSARVTIREVAHHAGVSVSTASKALNGNGRMTEDTRERILKAASELQFRPNAMARGLLKQRSFTVGLLTNDTYGRFTLPVASGISEALVDEGVSVFLCPVLDNDPRRAQVNVEAMQDKCVDALIVSGRRADARLPIDLASLTMPIIHVYSECGPNEIGFFVDEVQGARLAVEHLYASGRTRVAHVTGPDSFDVVAKRIAGWREASRAHDRDPFLQPLTGAWTEAWGFAAAERLFANGVPSAGRPDAVFCGNDQIARGLADALALRGINVPEDVAIVGFDNWEIFADAVRPPLTTIDMNLVELGRQAGQTLLELIEGRPVAPGHRYLPCRLIQRRSCGAGRDLS